MSLLQLPGYFNSKKLCLTFFVIQVPTGMMMMAIIESPKLLTVISCFHVKHDEGGFLLWWKVNRLKTIMWYDCCQLNQIWLSF